MVKKLVGALPNWERAVCRSMDPESFFADENVELANPSIVAACNRCEITAQCLAWAIANNETFGVWGGTTPKQRRQLNRPIARLRCPGCGSEALLEEPTTETCLSCGLSWRI